MGQRAIEIGHSVVIKRNTSDLIRIEAEKTRQAYRIAGQCGLFRVPRVLEHDDAKGELVLERIPGLVRLCDLSKRTPVYKTVMEQLGQALAIIHERLSLPDSMRHPLPATFDWPGTEVFLHGDFDTQNICLNENTSSLVILDWQMSPRYGEKGTYGSRYFDVMWLIDMLLWRPDMSYLVGDPVSPLVDRFLRSYISSSVGSLDPMKLSAYARAFFAERWLLRKHYAGKRRYLYPRSRMLTRRCLKRIERMPCTNEQLVDIRQ